MPITLIPETGTGLNPDANTYIDLDDADDYQATVLESEVWEDADEPTRQKSLIQAARVLDASFEWEGRKKERDQPLAWPRDGVGFDGRIPRAVKWAQCEIARALIAKGGFNPVQPAGEADIKSINLGKSALEIEYADAPQAAEINPITDYVENLLEGLGWSKGGRDKIVKTYRG